MPINSSPSLNVTLGPPPLPSSNSSTSLFYVLCLESVASTVIYSMYTFTNVLFIPLYIHILFMGFQRCQRQRSEPTSHSDFLTYHIVVMEIIGALGSFFYTVGIYTKNLTLLAMGLYPSNIIFPGQTLFHLLTCAERYLAVVHPIAYMRLRDRAGVRIRNVSTACIWLACCVWIWVTYLYLPYFPDHLVFVLMGVSLLGTFFCCISVLCVLTHPGPGEAGGKKERVNQSKRRSFHIICSITGALLLRFTGLLVTYGLSTLGVISSVVLCVVIDSGLLLSVPSSLVLPLLFLHKSGKLACSGKQTESG